MEIRGIRATGDWLPLRRIDHKDAAKAKTVVHETTTPRCLTLYDRTYECLCPPSYASSSASFRCSTRKRFASYTKFISTERDRFYKSSAIFYSD